MRGVYKASYKISSVTAAKTFVYITAPANLGVEILEVTAGNVSQDTAEQLEWYFARITTLGTPTATSVTPEKDEQGDQAAGSTVKFNVTASEPTYHTVYYDARGQSNLSPYIYRPFRDDRPIIINAASAGLYLATASLTSADFQVSIKFREFG